VIPPGGQTRSAVEQSATLRLVPVQVVVIVEQMHVELAVLAQHTAPVVGVHVVMALPA
jgi:hypothetical protein